MATTTFEPPRPTKRQSEYLDFIRAYTNRRGIPPSFEEIAQHFMTTPPSVNGMVKTLEAKGFLTRIPGQARTLRVTLPPDLLAPTKVTAKRAPSGGDETRAAVTLACLVIERVIPALMAFPEASRRGVLDAVRDALEVHLAATGASTDARRAAGDDLRRAALAAQGMHSPLRPIRRLPIATETAPSRANRAGEGTPTSPEAILRAWTDGWDRWDRIIAATNNSRSRYYFSGDGGRLRDIDRERLVADLDAVATMLLPLIEPVVAGALAPRFDLPRRVVRSLSKVAKDLEWVLLGEEPLGLGRASTQVILGWMRLGAKVRDLSKDELHDAVEALVDDLSIEADAELYAPTLRAFLTGRPSPLPRTAPTRAR